MSEQQAQGQEPVIIETTSTPDPWAAFPAEFNWVRKELEDTRKEAAEKRILAKELQEKLGSAKTPEEVQQITAAYDSKTSDLEVALARERVARKSGLSDDLVEFLTGKTEEELKAAGIAYKVGKDAGRPEAGGRHCARGRHGPGTPRRTEPLR